MEILTLLKANLKSRKGSFFSVAILMMIITLSMTVILSVTDDMKSSLKDSISDSGVGDLVSFIPEPYINDTLYQQINQNEHVDHVTDINAITAVHATVNGQKESCYTLLWEYSNNYVNKDNKTNKDNKINKEGIQYHFFNDTCSQYNTEPDDLKPGEIYVPYCFKTMYKCSVGDSVVIQTNQGDLDLTIKGFFEEPISGAYVIYTKQAFISHEDFETLAGRFDNELDQSEKYILNYHMMYFYQKADNRLDAYSFRQSLNDDSKVINYSYGTLSQDDSIEYTLMLPQIFGNMMLAFVFMLFIVVLIVMGNNISTGIEMEYVKLGVLKALGVSKRNLRLVLLAEYLIAELAGAAVGLLLALPVIRPLGNLFMKITGILPSSRINFGKGCLILLAILIISSVFIYIKTLKVAKISPVRAITGGKDAVYFDQTGTFPISSKAMNLHLAARQFSSNRKQYIGIAVIMTILIYFLMSITILTKGIHVEDVYEVFGGITSDVKMKMESNYTTDEQDDILQEINQITPVTYDAFTVYRYLTVDGNQYNATIHDNPNNFRSILKGKAPEYDNEIIVTELVSKMLGKGIGDTVTVAYREGEEEYVISGIYQSSVEIGKCIGMSLAGARRIGDFEPETGYIRIADKSKIDQVTQMCNDKFGTVLHAERSDNTDNLNSLIRLSLNVVTIWIFALTVLFVLVVVMISCRKMFLRERPDIGIYKALGFKVRQLRIQFAFRFLIVAFIGTVGGVILTVLFNTRMMLYLFRYIGVTTYNSTITVTVFLIPFLTICLSSFVFSYLMAGQIKKVAVTELVTE